MKETNCTEINWEDYKRIESAIDSINTRKEFIRLHKNLVGKSCKNGASEIKDCGVEFVKKMLSREWGRTVAYRYSEGAIAFFKSEYLSDYFKSNISELLSAEDLSDKVASILNSNKIINDMDEEELNTIYFSIKSFYAKETKSEKVSVASCFMSLLYKLDGKGVIAFIKNNVSNSDLASHILLTSGLNDRASYYSCYEVNYSYLNESNLIVIFEKMLKLDIDYAINFVELVQKMKVLSVTEFINSFKSFAVAGFKTDNLNINEGNDSFDEFYSEQMKSIFMSKIKPFLQNINPDYGLCNQSFCPHYIKNK